MKLHADRTDTRHVFTGYGDGYVMVNGTITAELANGKTYTLTLIILMYTGHVRPDAFLFALWRGEGEG